MKASVITPARGGAKLKLYFTKEDLEPIVGEEVANDRYAKIRLYFFGDLASGLKFTLPRNAAEKSRSYAIAVNGPFGAVEQGFAVSLPIKYTGYKKVGARKAMPITILQFSEGVGAAMKPVDIREFPPRVAKRATQKRTQKQEPAEDLFTSPQIKRPSSHQTGINERFDQLTQTVKQVNLMLDEIGGALVLDGRGRIDAVEMHTKVLF